MTYRYAAYGLSLCSDSPIPGLFPAEEKLAAGLAIHLDGVPESAEFDARFHQFSDAVDERGEPLLRVARCNNLPGFHFRYSDGTAFLISDSGSELWAEWRAPLTLEDAATYLLGPIFGFVLRLRGVLGVHASVIEVDGQALGFMGPAGAGKSTLAAAFAQKGFAVMSDDILALDRRDDVFYAQPGYPRLRLWPDSAKALFGTSDALPRLTPNWDKRYLALDSNPFRFQPTPRRLGGIYVIGNDENTRPFTAVEPMKARDAMLALLRENARGTLLDKPARARQFARMGELARRVPVKRLGASGDAHYPYPSALADAILEDFRADLPPAHV